MQKLCMQNSAISLTLVTMQNMKKCCKANVFDMIRESRNTAGVYQGRGHRDGVSDRI